jgi:hypothetical protein
MMQYRVGKLSEVESVGPVHLFCTNREHIQALALKIRVAVLRSKTHVHGASYCNNVIKDYQKNLNITEFVNLIHVPSKHFSCIAQKIHTKILEQHGVMIFNLHVGLWQLKTKQLCRLLQKQL